MKTEVKRGVCPGEKKRKKEKKNLCMPNFKTLYYRPKNKNKKTVSHPVLVLW